jgi:hypothetical protein
MARSVERERFVDRGAFEDEVLDVLGQWRLGAKPPPETAWTTVF